MTVLSETYTEGIRPLREDDLEAVIAIDTALSGTSRRGFFEKRLTATREDPQDYIYVGQEIDGRLVGYALARLVDGDFGMPGGRAALDAIGVDPAFQGRGVGRRIVHSVEEILSQKKVTSLSSQVEWANQSLIVFLAEAGFLLAPRNVLTRQVEGLPLLDAEQDEYEREEQEKDFSSPESDDPAALSHDRIPVRSMREDDLDAIIRIDHRTAGHERRAYFSRRMQEALYRSGVRISLVAEVDGYPAGFIMARMDFGEFGRTSPKAVMDAVGVDPGYQGHGVGQALMHRLLANLTVLRIDHVRTEIGWNDTDLITYLDRSGFIPAQYIVLNHNLKAS